MPILERARLALIGIDREQPRLGLTQQRPPLAVGWKSGATHAAQAGGLDLGPQGFARHLAVAQSRQPAVAAPFIFLCAVSGPTFELGRASGGERGGSIL